jgi:hypothetical protein
VIWLFTGLMASFCTPTIIVSCGLAPYEILLTDSLRSSAVSFRLSRRSLANLGITWFDPSQDLQLVSVL